jgi:starch synthase
LQWAPDVVHCNDWHTALIPLYLRTLYAWDRLFARTRTVLTIHNIGYQGTFGTDVLDDLGLRQVQHLFHQGDYREGRINCLRTGILYADHLTTVSRTYAREIQTAEHGHGLQDSIGQRASALTGIVNGVDYGEWNPEIDPFIAAKYGAADRRGKAVDKRALLERFQLPAGPATPLIGAVSRLTMQKGFELLPDSLPVLLREHDVRFVLLGSGEERYERYFQWLRDSLPHKVGFYRGFNDELAHQIEAGADMFLMPSRYEPCGLNQMYSLRYGTVPIVRHTGGLADTVTPFEPSTGKGTGFVFHDFTAQALLETMRWALRNYHSPKDWERCVQNGMAMDFSWDRQGQEYLQLYRRLAPAAA